MENNNIIDEHLIHDPSEGLGRMRSLIRTIGILAVVVAVLGVLGVFQQMFSIGQQFYQVVSSSFDKYMFYLISNMLTGSIMLILEIILTVFLFKFGLVAIDAGKRTLGQDKWDTLFKDLRNILITVLGLILITLFSYIINILLGLII